jgi:TP901 family phage tail tape measure protein
VESRLVVTIDPRGAQAGARVVNTELEGVRRRAREMTDQLDGSFNRLKQSLFSVQGAIAGIGIGDFVRRSIGSFVEFERGMANVSKTTDITGQALADLGNDLIRMSQRLPVAREQLLGIAASAGQLGIEGSANILKFTETVAKLGFASDLAGEEAATILARVINVAGEDIGTVDRLASSIVYLGRTSAASESEIARMVIELSKGTAQFKVSSANLVGLGTAMREFGQQPELARSAILRTFLALKSATDSGGEDLRTLGILAGTTGDQFKKAFQEDAFGAFLQFVSGLQSVIEQGGNAENVLASLGLNGTEINAVLPLLAVNFGRVTERVKEANKAYQENSDLNSVSQKAFETTAGKIQILRNSFNEFLRKVGAEAAPAFNQLLDKLIVFANSDAALVFGKALAVVLQLIADNAELLAIALAGIAINRTITFFTLLATVGTNAARALRAGTIEAVANATGMAAATRSANLYMISGEKIATSTGGASLATKAAAGGTYLFNTALGLLGINGPKVASAITTAAGAVAGFATRIMALPAINGLAAVAMQGLSVAAGALGVAFNLMLGPIGLIVLAIAAVVATFLYFKDTLVTLGPLNASVGNIVQATWNVVTQRVMDNVTQLASWIGGGLSSAADSVMQAFSSLGAALSGIWDSITSAASSAFDAVSEAVGSAVDQALNYFGGLLEPVAAVFSSIYDAISTAIQAAAEYIGEVVNAIAGVFQSLYDAITGIFQNIKNYVVDTFSGVIDYFRGLVDDVVGEANRLQRETDKAKNGSGATANAESKSPAEKATATAPKIPSPAAPPKVDLDLLKTATGSAGKGSGRSLESELKKLRNDSSDRLADSGLDELGQRLNAVDQAIRNTVGSYDKLTVAQRRNIEDTKAQIASDFEMEQSRRTIKQLIEETLTPQEKYNRAMEELTRLQPQTAEGFEAIRRKAEGLRKELEAQDPVLRENKRLTEQFNNDFEGVFKNGLQSVFTKGKAGWKDMLSGFKDLYFKTLTEITARPIMDAILGQKDASGQRSGGLLSGIISSIFGGGSQGNASGNTFLGFGGLLGQLFGKPQQAPLPWQQQQAPLPWLQPANDNFGANQGEFFADAFGEQSAGSSGFLGMLGNVFSPSGAGGGFLSSLGGLFSGLTSGLSGIFSGLSGMFSGLFGGGGGGFGGILNLASSIFSLIGFFADGGSVGARTPIIVGERGPELFIPPVDGEIISNDVFRRAANVSNDNIPRRMSQDIVALAMAGKFGGFRAGGGDVTAGMTYLGGERGRELYVPNGYGGSANDNSAQGGDTIVVNLNVTTQDAVSFKRSQGQIASDAARAISRAKRNL